MPGTIQCMHLYSMMAQKAHTFLYKCAEDVKLYRKDAMGQLLSSFSGFGRVGQELATSEGVQDSRVHATLCIPIGKISGPWMKPPSSCDFLSLLIQSIR